MEKHVSDEKQREEEALAAHPDPMAKARAVKAAKAAAKAQADLEQAERANKTAADGQPVVSSLKTRPAQVYEGEPVQMRVTFRGHGQISTGGEFGFERYARNAIITAAEKNARSLYEKNFAEPLDESYVDRWAEMARREQIAGAAAKAAFEDALTGRASGDYSSHDSFGGAAPR